MKIHIINLTVVLLFIANVSCTQNKMSQETKEETTPVEILVNHHKIFLSAENDWVTIISYRDWIEPVIENYAGKYEFLQPAQDEDGEFFPDGYIFITEIKFNDGNIAVLRYGNIEYDSQGVDTLSKNRR